VEDHFLKFLFREVLEELRGLGFAWTRIAEMIGVSRWTIHRRGQSMA